MISNNTIPSPILERDFLRSSKLGYEPEGSYGYIRCLEHGVPDDMSRWHHHKEYELHLILETKGKMFVGDYVGNFEPGNLVLTGPYLPHSWVTNDVPPEGIERRDFGLQFSDKPFRKSCEYLPELKQALPLLDRAKNGIEFFGVSDYAERQITRIKNASGIYRFNIFLELILELSKHSDYQLLSYDFPQTYESDVAMERISGVVDYLAINYSNQFTMAEMAKKIDMNGSQFSRYFKIASGNTFTEFVNKLRINKACQMLIETDKYISTICYDVGYNTVANFNRRFAEIKHMTPTAYRQLSKIKFD